MANFLFRRSNSYSFNVLRQSFRFNREVNFCAHFSGHCFGLIPASGSVATSAFPVPPQHRWFPPRMQSLALEAEALAFGCPRKMGQKKETFHVLYIC